VCVKECAVGETTMTSASPSHPPTLRTTTPSITMWPRTRGLSTSIMVHRIMRFEIAYQRINLDNNIPRLQTYQHADVNSRHVESIKEIVDCIAQFLLQLLHSQSHCWAKWFHEGGQPLSFSRWYHIWTSSRR
jgi:hypothetical protein